MPRLVRHSVLVIIGKHISLPKSPKGPSQSRKVSKSLFPSVRQGRLRECSSCGPRESYTKHHYLGHGKPGCSFQSRSLELRSPGPASHPHQTPAPFQGSGRTACRRLLPILGNPTAFPTGPWVTVPKWLFPTNPLQGLLPGAQARFSTLESPHLP